MAMIPPIKPIPIFNLKKEMIVDTDEDERKSVDYCSFFDDALKECLPCGLCGERCMEFLFSENQYCFMIVNTCKGYGNIQTHWINSVQYCVNAWNSIIKVDYERKTKII